MAQPLLYTLDELITATSGRFLGESIQGISDISIDTRTLQKGDAYFAIKGDVHDGHKFVSDAIKNGASLCVVSQDKLSDLDQEKNSFLVVKNVLSALEDLARHSRARSSAKIVAVTGSVGKTTTKEMLRLALGKNVHASQASYNNHWGVPLSLAKMPTSTLYGVFEIGMNHAGEITPLVKMVRPDVALLNNVAPVHLESFNSVEEIADAKAEIFHGLSSGGIAVLDKDSKWFNKLNNLAKEKNGVRVVTFGQTSDSDSYLKNFESHDSHSHLEIILSGNSLSFTINTLGHHMAKNASAVLAVLHSLDADITSCVSHLELMQPIKGRGVRHKLQKDDGTFTLIDESYNANPASMKAAIDLLGQSQPPRPMGRRIAVLGDMLELGDTSSELHSDLHISIKKNKIDRVFLVGDQMLSLQTALNGDAIHTKDIDSQIEKILDELRPNDIIMAKASFGMAFSRLIDALLQRFPSADSTDKRK